MNNMTNQLTRIREIVEEWNNHGQGSAIKMNNIAAIIGEQPPAASQPSGAVTDEQIIEIMALWAKSNKYDTGVAEMRELFAADLAASQPPAASQPA